MNVVKTLSNPVRSAHVDTFCADSLPPREMWPVIDVAGIPDCQVERMNAATELLDNAIAKGWGERLAYLHAEGSWTYRRLFENANQIANVLVNQLRLIPGNRVLLRGYNHPMLVACWFAVVKNSDLISNPLTLGALCGTLRRPGWIPAPAAGRPPTRGSRGNRYN